MADYTDALGWDDEVAASDKEYVLLEPGEYTYRVDDFERGRFDGSDKMGPCPVAKLTLSCSNAAGQQASVVTRLYLTKRQQWKLTQFFKSCGLIDASLGDGQAYRMPWDQVRGAIGRAEIGNREYQGRTYNEVTRFIVPEQPKRTYGAL
jgi:hypothetical protein